MVDSDKFSPCCHSIVLVRQTNGRHGTLLRVSNPYDRRNRGAGGQGGDRPSRFRQERNKNLLLRKFLDYYWPPLILGLPTALESLSLPFSVDEY